LSGETESLEDLEARKKKEVFRALTEASQEISQLKRENQIMHEKLAIVNGLLNLNKPERPGSCSRDIVPWLNTVANRFLN